jgi:hypothetical protein
MTSGERQPANNEKKSWSYDTPYDMQNYATILAEQGPDSVKIKDIYSYIDYINDEMDKGFSDQSPRGYRVVTQMGERLPYGTSYSHGKTTIYKPDQNGAYMPHTETLTHGEFMGDFITITDDTIIVVNTMLGMGVPVRESVKMVNVGTANTYDNGYRKYDNFTRMAGKRLLDEEQRRMAS